MILLNLSLRNEIMTEFLQVLRYGSRKEKRKVLKYAGLGSYYKYGIINQPGTSKIIKKNQIQINDFFLTIKIWFIKIKYRRVFLINPCFAYDLIYTTNGKLVFMRGESLNIRL